QLDFSFDVSVLDPNFRVKDNSLAFGEASIASEEGTFGVIDITEFIFDGMDLIGDKEITFDSDGTANLSDDANFAPLTMISIETSILLLADDNGVDGVATASLGSFTQNFSQERVQVPEPASLALLGLGLAGLGFTRRRRVRA
ncbi:MAG: PEP-CTERM sorting domain-containing protein, partial [Gammaproteobacteria bacterium]